jgi:hypothetical protein
MYIYILKEIFPIPHRHDITEILLNVALNTINLNNSIKCSWYTIGHGSFVDIWPLLRENDNIHTDISTLFKNRMILHVQVKHTHLICFFSFRVYDFFFSIQLKHFVITKMAFVDIHLLVQTVLYFCIFLSGFAISIPIGVNKVNFDMHALILLNWKLL